MTQEILGKMEEAVSLLNGELEVVEAKISPFGVEVFGKVISVEDFSKALIESTSEDPISQDRSNLPVYKTPGKVLPNNILKYNGNNSTTTISLYFPETYADVSFVKSGEPMSMRKNMRIVVPNVIVTSNYRKVEGSINDWEQSGEVRYFCSNRTLADLKKSDFIYESNPSAGVWVLALPNMFSNGRMCTGSSNENLLPRSIQNGDFSRIGYNYYFLLEAPFNSDLGIPDTADGYASYNWLELLESIVQDGGRFPYEKLRR